MATVLDGGSAAQFHPWNARRWHAHLGGSLAGPARLPIILALCVLLGPIPAAAAPSVRLHIDRGLSHLKVETCVARRCAVRQIGVDDMQQNGTAHRVGRSLAISTRGWLHPNLSAADRPFDVTITPPPGLSVSHPWPEAPPGTCRVPPTALQREAWIVVGDYERVQVDSQQTQIDVVILDGRRRATNNGIRAWLAQAVRVVGEIRSPLPFPRVQVIVVPRPGSRRGSPVPYGFATAGGGPGLVLLLSDTATDADLLDDWVAVHELLHHTLPWLPDNAPWFDEGLTTYYEIVLRARAGIRTPAQAWKEIGRGVAKAERRATAPLRRVSRRMRSAGGHGQVYWGGVAMALLWDVTIRSESGGRRSLDDALRHLITCCAGADRAYELDDVLRILDRWYGRPFFSQSAARELVRPMPSLSSVWRLLGMTSDGLPTTPTPRSRIRDRIMTVARSSHAPQ